MKKNKWFLVLVVPFFLSCMAESNNLSPLVSSFYQEGSSNDSSIIEKTENSLDKNVYASEISQAIATFPKTSNKKLNQKISLLKYQMQYYLEVNEVTNLEKKARENVENTYKNIQTLAKKLPEDEKELVKIHLVKVKTNITKLNNNNFSQQ